MNYTFEFYRIRPGDKAHATLERIQHEASDLDAAMMKSRSLFGSLDLRKSLMAFAFSMKAEPRSSYGTRRTMRPAGSETSVADSQPGLITAGAACCRSAKLGPIKYSMPRDMQRREGC